MTSPDFRPVRVMAELSKTFERTRISLPVSALVVLHAPIKSEVIRDAVDALVAEGHLVDVETAGGPRRHRVLRLSEPFPPSTGTRRPATASRLVDLVHAESSNLIGAYLGAQVARDEDETARLRCEIATACRNLETALELLTAPTPLDEEDTPHAPA